MLSMIFWQAKLLQLFQGKLINHGKKLHWIFSWQFHYNDVIMGAVVSQITRFAIIYSIVYSGANQRKHQSSASLAFVRGIHRWSVKTPYKGPVTRKVYPFDDVIMFESPLNVNLDSYNRWNMFLGHIWSTTLSSVYQVYTHMPAFFNVVCRKRHTDCTWINGSWEASHYQLGIAFAWQSNAYFAWIEWKCGTLRRHNDVNCKALLIWSESHF